MTVVKSTVWTEQEIENLPTPAQRKKNYYLGKGLTVVVMPTGKRYFTLYATITTSDGWFKRVQRMLGYWPEMSLDEARRQALYYRTVAESGVDIRRDRAEITELQQRWRGAKQPDPAKEDARQQRLDASNVRRMAKETARQIKRAAQEAARRAAEQARRAAEQARQEAEHKRRQKIVPELFEALSKQAILNVPWKSSTE